MPDVVVTGLRVEHFVDAHPLSVHTPLPRLSWRSETATADWQQIAWAVEAVSDDDQAWSSGRVEGRDSLLVPWVGDPLPSRAAVRWRVRVWGLDGSTGCSGWAYFEVGLLTKNDWTAVAVGPDWSEDLSRPQPAAILRRTFALEGDVVRARLHVTALGIYVFSLNGSRIGDHELAPGWTSYQDRIHVQTFDVLEMLRPGENELSALLADGWWRGALGPLGRRNNYGDRTALLAQLELTMADGTSTSVATDELWRAAQGPVRAGDLYDGETYDARYAPSPWEPVRTVPVAASALVPQATPPVRVTEVVRPVQILTSPSGRTIVDFGKNLVGVLRIRVQGPAGTEITLRHAEVLEDGELCTRVLRAARATDRYILRGEGLETWRPTTTFHGFRWAEVTGWPGELRTEDLEALVLHSDLPTTGTFTCSSPEVNQLHQNIMRSWRGNTVSLPTDCPQRDERLGWTGDLQVFASTASFLTDTAAFLDAWLADLSAEQLPDGRVPATVPALPHGAVTAAAGWGDAATVVPDVLHMYYGDQDLLRRQLPSMRGWVDSITALTGPGRLWDEGFQYGDWVDPTVDPRTPAASRTDAGYVATAYYIRSARLVASAASAVGAPEVAERYRSLADEVLSAFREQYVAPSGRVVADTQTGCALALMFDLVPDERRDIVGDRLRNLVRNEGHRLSTGFLGTPVLVPALTAAGNLADAYKCLLNDKPPGWLYPVSKGATTVWEHWEAIRPDGSLNTSGEMLSFNHYAFGAIADWLHQTVGGLTPVSPGFRTFRVAPEPGVGISAARTGLCSRYGQIEVTWEVVGRGLDLTVRVPPNTSASVVPPGLGGNAYMVGSGVHRWRYGVSEEVYRQWVAHTFGPASTLDELASDASAWSIVQEVAPQLDALRGGFGFAPLGALRGTSFSDVLDPLLARLAELDKSPPEPERIWPQEAPRRR